MGRAGIIVTGLVAAALIIGGIVITNNKSKDNKAVQNTNSSTTQSQPAQASDTSNTTTQPETAAPTITYTSSGFSPSSITVKRGDAITIKNNSSQTVEFYSDDHPTHTKNPELNIGTVGPGGTSMTFMLNTSGTWGYHNHLNSSQTGTIVVR